MREFPELTVSELALVYTKRYGIVLRPSLVSKALNSMGIYRQGKADLAERKERPARLKQLHKLYPAYTYEQLASEYNKLYKSSITTHMVNRTMNRLGLYRVQIPKPKVLKERVKRLKAIAVERPELNKKELIEEYGRRCGETLNAHSTRATLRRLGVYLSRSAATAQRMERLLAIAEACPELSRAEIVREYARLFGETISVPSTLATMRRLGVLSGRR